MRLEPLNVCLTDRRLNQLSYREVEIRERWNFRKADWKKWASSTNKVFEEWISKIEWESCDLDVDNLYESFCATLKQTAEEVIEKKRICKHSKGFFSQEVKVRLKNVRKYKRIFNTRSDPANFKKFREAKESLCTCLKNEEEKYWTKLMKDLDIKNPEKFWRSHRKHYGGQSKLVTQPLRKGDGSIAKTDTDMAEVISAVYGEEILEVEKDNIWFKQREEEAHDLYRKESENIRNKLYNPDPINEDFTIEEVSSSIKEMNDGTTPNPYEKVFTLMIKKGGYSIVKALHKLFLYIWQKGLIPQNFINDAKIIIPKPGKSDYNNPKSYRPIALGSLVGKILERMVNQRLLWISESQDLFDLKQDAYRPGRMCTQSILRLVQSVFESWQEGKTTVAVVMDFDSCYERIWRSGLLCKIRKMGISGRIFIYLANFLNNRKYQFSVNSKKTMWKKSKVGIPQGQVLSPTLCNLYTSDAMKDICSDYLSYADDNVIWKSGKNLKEVEQTLQKDVSQVCEIWCSKWNMKISAGKTKIMIFSRNRSGKIPDFTLQIGGTVIPIVSDCKMLGLHLDEALSFTKQIQVTSKCSYRALKQIETLIQPLRGCRMSAGLQLYKSLVLSRIEYGAAVVITAHDKMVKEYEKIQRTALLRISGCLHSTSSSSLEVICNQLPIDIHLSLRQAQDYIRIQAKPNKDSLKTDFNRWSISKTIEKPCSPFQLLQLRYRELGGELQGVEVEQDVIYEQAFRSFGSQQIPKIYLQKCIYICILYSVI